MEAAQVQLQMFAMYERMFLDSEKDITFELADGQEYAPKAVLKAASDVFAGMFRQDMRESVDSVVSLPDTKRIAMRVFLRLLYVGHVDPSDWGDAPPETEATEPGPIPVLRHAGIQVNQGTLRITNGDWHNGVLLDTGDAIDFEFTLRSVDWNQFSAMIGVAPRDTSVGSPMCNRAGFFAQVYGGKLVALYAQDGTSGKAFPGNSSPALPSGAALTVKFQDGALMFSVDGGSFVVAEFNTNIPRTDVPYVPAVSISSVNTSLEVVSVTTNPRECKCPLDILMSVALLAHKYMVSNVLSMAVQALKRRLADAAHDERTSTFQRILAAAIQADLGAVRMAALGTAKEFTKLREEFDAGKLRPEVANEIEAIWPSPSAGTFTVRRLA